MSAIYVIRIKNKVATFSRIQASEQHQTQFSTKAKLFLHCWAWMNVANKKHNFYFYIINIYIIHFLHFAFSLAFKVSDTCQNDINGHLNSSCNPIAITETFLI